MAMDMTHWKISSTEYTVYDRKD